MPLLTNELIRTIPKLYETEKIEDKTILIKLFNPNGIGTWYIVEYDEESKEAFGYVDLGYYPELTYFSIPELEAYRGPLGIGIERDLNFIPTLYSEIPE